MSKPSKPSKQKPVLNLRMKPLAQEIRYICNQWPYFSAQIKIS